MQSTHVAVQKGQRIETALGDGGNLPITENCFDDDVGESSALQVLHDDPQLAISTHQVAVHVVDQVTMMQLPHHLRTHKLQVSYSYSFYDQAPDVNFVRVIFPIQTPV